MYIGMCIFFFLKKGKMKPKSYVKRVWKVRSVNIHRNVLKKSKKDSPGKKHISQAHSYIQTHELMHADASEKILKYTKFGFRIFLFSHPNLDAFSLWTHGLVPFPREVITIGHCSVRRPQVKILPLVEVIGTSKD